MGWLLFGCIAFLVIIFVGVSVSLKSTKKDNQRFDGELHETGFVVSKKISIGDCALYIDDESKKFCVKGTRGSKLKIYNFEDLINYEIYEDGNSIAKGKSGKALAGGLLFGVTGAVIGASGSKKSKQVCSKLSIDVTVNDLQNPLITINILDSEFDKTSLTYKNYLNTAKEMAAALSYIQSKQ